MLFLFSFALSAQQPKILAPHDPIAPKVSKAIAMPPAASASIDGGPWMVDANFKSTIYLKNIVENSSVTITPVLHLSNGATYQLSAIQIPAGDIAAVDVGTSLQSLGISSYATLSGWVELQYNWGWVPICAVIRNVDVAHSMIFTFGYEAPAPSASQVAQAASQTIEGLWWKQESNVTGFLTLSNTTSQPIKAIVQVSDNQATVLGTYNVTVTAGGMKMLNLQELQTASAGEGGIRVSYVGEPDSLLINGGLEDPSVGYSANLRFSPRVRPAPPMSQVNAPLGIAEVGLMVGPADPMMRFPAGTIFTPYSVLRNVSTASMLITPTLWWMQGGAANSFQLPQFTMLPGQARTMDLASALASAGLKNLNGGFNLAFDTGGNSGLLMAGGSVDQTQTYVFEVAARGIAKSAGKSLSYWSTGSGDDTMVTLWNPADEAQNFIFRLTFAGGHYDLPIQLGPRATRTFNISQIIATQVPDAQGSIIPPNIQEGSAKIVGDQADNQNILVVMDSGVYNVQKATCGGSCQNCDGGTSWTVLLNPFYVPIGFQNNETLTAQWCDGSQYNVTGSAVWASSNTNIATVPSPGVVHGVATGSFTASAGTPSAPICAPQCNPYGSCPAFLGGGGGAPGNVTPPHITSISPNYGTVGTNVPVTISGTGFGTSPQLSSDGTGITFSVSNTPPPSNNSFTATFSIANSAPLGSQNISVINNGTTSDNTQIFQVTPAGSAVPVNYQLIPPAVDLGAASGGVTLAIERNFTWTSTTGNLGDLSICSMREYVTYPNTNNKTCPNNSPPQMCYYPASPPWAASGGQYAYPNPTSPSPGPANGGKSQDVNSVSNLNFVKPYVANSFPSTQYVQYSCNSGPWINLYGPVTITRSVFQSGTKWIGRVSASDTTVTSSYTLP